jgi:enhancing lycopene biosynthesis protein 2
MKKIALVLSGCGGLDGAEITETVSLMVALHQLGAEISYFAPDMEFEVHEHLTRKKTDEKRNILTEAARITRGNISDIKKLHAKDFDGLAFPGGSGAAKNFSTWGTKGAACEVIPEVTRVIKEFHSESKPIAAICIAPTLVAKVLGSEGVEITLGDAENEASQEAKKTGAHLVTCPSDDYVTDRNCKVITTPAYMCHAKPHQVFKGISGLAKELVEMS